MILVAVAWIYVVLMVAVVEATGPGGTLLGAFVTFAFYGLLPLGIVLYLMLSPARRRARRAGEVAALALSEQPSTAPLDPDRSGHATGDAVAPIRKEP